VPGYCPAAVLAPWSVAAATSLCNRRRMARRAELNGVIPVLPARDVSEAVRFYVERLGFEVVFQDSDDRPQYAGIRRGAVELHLQFQFEKDFEAGTAGQAMLRLIADNPGMLFAEYKDKGVFHEGTQLADTSWCTREFAFWDLNHNGLTFMRDL
jgi:catechol 2,3-dioxygenase-like lactoylglutathione lyase family enzyme